MTLQISIVILCMIPLQYTIIVQALRDITMIEYFMDIANYVNADTIHFNGNETLELMCMKHNGNSLWIEQNYTDVENPRNVVLRIHLGAFDQFLANFQYIHKSVGTKFNESVIWMIKETNEIHKLQNISPDIKMFMMNVSMVTKEKPMINISYVYMDYRRNKISSSYFGMWTPSHGLKTSIKLSNCCYNLTGYVMNVVYMPDEMPFTKLDDDGLMFSGIYGSIFSVLVRHHKIRLDNYHTETTYGGLDQGNATGLFSWLQNKEADVAVASTAMTKERMALSDFSISINEVILKGLYLKRPEDVMTSFYGKSFSDESWILICCSFFALIVINVVIQVLNKSADILESIIVQIGSFLNQDAGYDIKLLNLRIFHFSMQLLGFLLVAFLSSKIVEEKATNNGGKTFTHVTAVATDNEYYPIVLYNGATSAFLKSLFDERYKLLWNRIKNDIDKHTVKRLANVHDKLKRDKCVFIGEGAFIDYLKSKDATLTVIDSKQTYGWIAFAFRKNFPLTKIFNHGFRRLLSAGVINRIITPLYRMNEKSVDDNPRQIIFHDVRMPLVILGVGIAVSVVFLALESVFARFNNKTIKESR